MKFILPELKNTSTFVFAKLRGELNNREAARFCELLHETIDSTGASPNAIAIYLEVCREPNIDRNYFKGSSKDNEKQSRSRLVMEYERHRKAYKKIVQIRLHNREAVDSIVDKMSMQELNGTAEKRLAVLSQINEKLTLAPRSGA